MKVIQITYDKDGNLFTLTDDGNMFMRQGNTWQYIAGPAPSDLPKIDSSISISDVVDES